jgi:Baseplate J-like protein
MPLLLPNLDDRRWADLVDEGRALIPVYGPEWTDHNAHDPGITLMELLAWIAESDIYSLNQISDADRRKFLKLVGITTRPPLPARVILSFSLSTAIPQLVLPAGAEFSSAAAPNAIRFRTSREVSLVAGSLAALQFRDAKGFQDLTPVWNRHRAFNPLGVAAQKDSEFYLGLSTALPVDVPANFYFTFADDRSSAEEKKRLLDEEELRAKNCRPGPLTNPCTKSTSSAPTSSDPPAEETPLRHPGVRIVWEFLALENGQQTWRALNPNQAEVDDRTRSFTLNGSVTIRVPAAMTPAKLGSGSLPLFYLRCRIAAGAFDAAPQLLDVAFNCVTAVQSIPLATHFKIAHDATIQYSPAGPPKPHDLSALYLELDTHSHISKLIFGAADSGDPLFRILEFAVPTAGAVGKLVVETAFLGAGNGMPAQQVTLPNAPIDVQNFQLFTLAGDAWNKWTLRPDFDSSSREDFHALLDPSSGTITFGNGENGRVPPSSSISSASTFAPSAGQCLIFATASVTSTATGNVAAKIVSRLSGDEHNRALFHDSSAVPDGLSQFKSKLASVSNPLPAIGGSAEETIAHASGRADQLITSVTRAVTLADYESLALRTPGTRVSRATAIANMHPSFPCFSAPGIVTVVVLPFLPAGRPVPTPGFLRAITSYLRRRRVIGTRVEVVGPTYVSIAVRASVQSTKGIAKAALQQSIVNALNSFFDPLTGGPNGTGWPFGRDVYRSEIMRIIGEVPGVDHVLSMDLLTGHSEAQCGNVCLGPISLVAGGNHEITVQ